MSKLQRSVDGQTIQFIPLPRIFQSLSSDLPSGAVPLPNGESAFWRLHRNVTELKRQRKNVREMSVQLAQAFKALVNSDAFRNHYGLTAVPAIQSEQDLASVFRNLLQINNNRVDYSTISHGNKKPLVESLTVPMGNLVFLNAYRGLMEIPKVSGIKGKLWLTDGADENQFFKFTIVSPTLKLPDYISAERLKTELLGKIKQNLQIMTHNPKIVFDDGQFDNFLNNQLSALVSQHPSAANGKQKQKTVKLGSANPAIVGVKETEAMHRESFEELDEIGRMAYLGKIRGLAESGKKEDRSTLIAYLVSGIMEAQWEKYNSTATPRATQPYFLALSAGIGQKQFIDLMGEDEPIYQPRVKAQIGVTYKVISGDTLWALAAEAYGDGELYGLIHEANKEAISDPDMIFPGQELDIPGLGQGATLVETIDYTVEEGDTAKSISQAAYGSESFWGNVMAVNPGVFFEDGSVTIGTVIQLPVIVDETGGTEEVSAEELSDLEPPAGAASEEDGGEKIEGTDDVPFDYSATGSVGEDPEDLPDGTVEGVVGTLVPEHQAIELMETLGETIVPEPLPVVNEVKVELEVALEVATKDLYIAAGEGLSVKSFLETHAPENFISGSWTNLAVGDEGALLKVVLDNGVWYAYDDMNKPLVAA